MQSVTYIPFLSLFCIIYAYNLWISVLEYYLSNLSNISFVIKGAFNKNDFHLCLKKYRVIHQTMLNAISGRIRENIRFYHFARMTHIHTSARGKIILKKRFHFPFDRGIFFPSRYDSNFACYYTSQIGNDAFPSTLPLQYSSKIMNILFNNFFFCKYRKSFSDLNNNNNNVVFRSSLWIHVSMKIIVVW